MKRSKLLAGSSLLLLCICVTAQAAIVANDDDFAIPSSKILLVEPLGVLENDRLNGETDFLSATLLADVSKGTLECPGDVSLQLCADGSFQYTPDTTSFDGFDSFTYRASGGGETATATVTLSACNATVSGFTCWHEGSYLARLTELGYNAFRESFEGTPWDLARSDFLNTVAVASVTSRDVIWTSNYPATNGITTSQNAARSGSWGAYDPAHGSASGNTGTCDVNNPIPACRPFDGLSGSGTNFYGVGGYFSSVTTGGSIKVTLDGTPVNLGSMTGSNHRKGELQP